MFVGQNPQFIDNCCERDVYTISSVRVGNTVTFTRNDGVTYSFDLPADIYVTAFDATETGLEITLSDTTNYTVNWATVLGLIGIASYTFNPIDGLFTITDNQLNTFSTAGNYKGQLVASPILGVAGDYYFNTVGNEYVLYDVVRGKWLSMNDTQLDFGRPGTINDGNPLCTFGGVVMTISGAITSVVGMTLEADSTIVGMYVQRQNDSNNPTIGIYKNNDILTILATATFPSPNTRFADNTLDVDVLATDVLGAYVATNTIVNPAGYLKIKRKY